MDKIIIHHLKVETIIGLFPWEREVRQTLLIDLEMGTDIQAAAATEDLAKTIDYAAVCEQVVALANNGKFKLIETFAERIANLVFSDFFASWVKVTVNKMGAVPLVSSVGVSIERKRDR